MNYCEFCKNYIDWSEDYDFFHDYINYETSFFVTREEVLEFYNFMDFRYGSNWGDEQCIHFINQISSYNKHRTKNYYIAIKYQQWCSKTEFPKESLFDYAKISDEDWNFFYEFMNTNYGNYNSECIQQYIYECNRRNFISSKLDKI